MKMTMTDGTVFEGSMAEYAELLAFAKTQQAEESAVKAESKPRPFAEGDIVVITANTTQSENNVGDIGKIDKVGTFRFKIVVPNGPRESVWSKREDFRKATPAEVEAYEKALHKASFSVGDYVKIVKSFIGIEGDIVKITDAGAFPTPKGIVDFIIEDVPNKREGIYGVFADQIVKATEQEVADASKPKLKAGDFVKITRRMAHYNNDKIYEVIESDGRLGIIDEDIEFNPGAIFGGDYVLVSAEEAAKYADEAKWAKIGRKVGEFRKGDIVRVTSGVHDGHAVGTIGVVAKDSIEEDFAPLVSAQGSTYWDEVEIVATVESTLK